MPVTIVFHVGDDEKEATVIGADDERLSRPWVTPIGKVTHSSGDYLVHIDHGDGSLYATEVDS